MRQSVLDIFKQVNAKYQKVAEDVTDQDKPVVESAPDDKSISEPTEKEDQDQTQVISDKNLKLLSQQVGNEFYAAYTYYGASGWFDLKGLEGFAKFAKGQADGEIQHAMKVFNHLIIAGAKAVLPPLESAPITEYKDVMQVCESIVAHEKAVTKNWREICKEAMASGDGATLQLATWFLAEQLEEENTAGTLRDRVKMGGDAGILVIDAELKG